jgi:hypothetical protein
LRHKGFDGLPMPSGAYPKQPETIAHFPPEVQRLHVVVPRYGTRVAAVRLGDRASGSKPVSAGYPRRLTATDTSQHLGFPWFDVVPGPMALPWVAVGFG